MNMIFFPFGWDRHLKWCLRGQGALPKNLGQLGPNGAQGILDIWTHIAAIHISLARTSS